MQNDNQYWKCQIFSHGCKDRRQKLDILHHPPGQVIKPAGELRGSSSYDQKNG